MEQAVQVIGRFTPQQIDVMRKTVAAGTTPEDFLVFLEVCKHRGLNPFAREIYAIVRANKMTIQVSIDGFRKLAERSGKYRGQLGPYFCGPDGIWKEEWLLDTPPTAAKVGVIHADFERPMWAVARHKAYVQDASPIWRKMPDLMLAKCAEALALRKAFPDEMSGLYTHEEMAQAGKPDNDAFKRPVEQPESAIIETTVVSGEVVESTPIAQETLTIGKVRTMAYHAGYKGGDFNLLVAGIFGHSLSDEELKVPANLERIVETLQAQAQLDANKAKAS